MVDGLIIVLATWVFLLSREVRKLNRRMRELEESSKAQESLLVDNRCEGCGEVADDLKADAGDNVICGACRNLP